jgi:hypothetical protein
MLTLSTAHMTEKESKLLAAMAKSHAHEPGCTALWVSDTGYGYLIRVNLDPEYVEQQDQDIIDEDLSDGILGTVRFARYHGARWLRFDRDGDIVNGLPTWDW